ncbi:predicted acetyltransferase [Vibrio maritimus]|uniref:Predicted acetyltransferase n=1 Tax=Vibrio maritimus TaxID=990268 RepID=A0A090TWK9_9VIBR|nr:predicted acetyltransferase [Vibrio maritimus]
MHLKYKITDPKCEDFSVLVQELNTALDLITADTGESSFERDEFNPVTDGCIVVYAQDKAIACGIFRKHQDGSCELKRMFSKVKGAGSYLISQLEWYARQKGYERAVLSTRRVNELAINFYKRQGYREIEPYGKYVHTDRSICLGKALTI